uniref:GNAT family N-acetyltransferase n=1 Tax=Halomonas sp. TaxID=1486246 RepID=UPI00261928FA|nr:GNAT family N-acetyltransferase [Halomonas sp.]
MTPSSIPAHKVIVRRGDLADLPRLSKSDFSFEVAAELTEPFTGVQIAPVAPPYRKDYGFDADELAEYLDRPDGALFVALVNGNPIGYMAVSQVWNNYALIEDIAVDAPHRGIGVARFMMDAAVEWARGAALAGVRLETQSNNITACRFYERYGFVLGGHDRYLYRGIHPDSREVALFWYLHF